MMAKPETSRALAVPTNRMTRFGKLSMMSAGIAGNMAVQGIAELGQGKKPTVRDLLLTPKNITKIAEQLAQMRGAAMKIGQLMSMDTGEVLPPELARIMARLRDDAHFMPPAQLKQVLNTQWRPDWLRSFKHFNVRPIAAASIGQVHFAKLKDGRELAIKVQYPGVAKSIDSDVANVGALIKMTGLLPKGFDLGPYLDEARQQLHEETDYVREGDQMERFAQLLEPERAFTLPRRQSDWSTKSILAMTFVQGQPIEETYDLPQDQRNAIVADLIELALKELFSFQLMQTDPNFANYLFDRDKTQIVLLDFGASRDVPADTRSGYLNLLRAGMLEDAQQLRNAAEQLGFVAADTPEHHASQIMDMIGLVFSFLKQSKRFDFSDNALSNEMQKRGTALVESGYVPPPVGIDVLLVQRKFGGTFLLGNRLNASVDVAGLLQPYLASID